MRRSIKLASGTSGAHAEIRSEVGKKGAEAWSSEKRRRTPLDVIAEEYLASLEEAKMVRTRLFMRLSHVFSVRTTAISS